MLPNNKRVKIAFQGMEGAFSNMAAKACFPNGDYVPCVSFVRMWN